MKVCCRGDEFYNDFFLFPCLYTIPTDFATYLHLKWFYSIMGPCFVLYYSIDVIPNNSYYCLVYDACKYGLHHGLNVAFIVLFGIANMPIKGSILWVLFNISKKLICK